MRMVTCRITGEKGSSDEFYKSENGRYYKSKEIYDEHIRNETLLKDIMHFINSKFLKNNRAANSGLTRKLINESVLKYEDILRLLNEYYDDINEYLFDKDDLSPGSKIIIIFKFITSRNTSNITYAGCYMIKNNYNSSIYIGESVDLFARFQKHIADLYEGIHHCKKLQNDFNVTKNLRDFIITPLYIFPVLSIDKKKEKEETLYLEAAFYLKYKYEKCNLYNTINPYMALKNGNAKYIEDGDVSANDVLYLLYEDKYNILSSELKKRVRKNLEDIIENTIKLHKNISKSNVTSSPKKQEIKQKTEQFERGNNYILTSVFEECKNSNILPENYDYTKVRNVLVNEDIISINGDRKSIATNKSIENRWIVLKPDYKDKPVLKAKCYYITEEGKNKFKEVLSKHDSSEYEKDFDGE